MRHELLRLARLPVPPLGPVGSLNGPCGNRTRPCGLRGRRPEPIDERADFNWVVKELNLSSTASLFCDNGFTGRREEHNPSSGTGGSRTRNHQGLSLAALPVCVPCHDPLAQKASPTGFEPVISCLTGRRALQAAPRGRVFLQLAQVGLEPTASLVLSESGLPIAYRAASASAQRGSRTHKRPGLSRAALPIGVPGPNSPGRNRTAVAWV